MSKYFIEIDPKAEKNLKTFPKNYYQNIRQQIDELAYNPFPSGYKKLQGSDLYRIRVGVYRIIYSVHLGKLIVHVINIAHRKDAYKK